MFPLSPSPLDGGGGEWGWTKRILVPLPFFPSRQGKGDFED